MLEDMGTLRSLVDLQHLVVEDLESWMASGLTGPPGRSPARPGSSPLVCRVFDVLRRKWPSPFVETLAPTSGVWPR